MFEPIPLREDTPWGFVPPPQECGEPLVDITHLDRRVTYGAAYLLQGLPGAFDRCYVRADVWRRLQRAADLLPGGYGLHIFDALRPLAVQRGIYNLFSARFRADHPGITTTELTGLLDSFVAKPVKNLARPAPHTTGGAVDLTLTLGGVPVDMGTVFDDTTPRAFTDYYERNSRGAESVRNHRRLLHHVMTSAGFSSYECEWWHFAYGERMWAKDCGETPKYGFCAQCDLD